MILLSDSDDVVEMTGKVLRWSVGVLPIIVVVVLNEGVVVLEEMMEEMEEVVDKLVEEVLLKDVTEMVE